MIGSRLHWRGTIDFPGVNLPEWPRCSISCIVLNQRIKEVFSICQIP